MSENLLNDDAINEAMMTGLREALRDELKTTVIKQLEETLDSVIDKIMEQVEVNVNNCAVSPFTQDRKIKVEWAITHTHRVTDKKKEDNSGNSI